MSNREAVTLSLTSHESHTIVREPGVGSLTIGPPTAGGPPPDVIVGVDEAIDWSAFDPLTVPAGYPWPRSLHYRGNDTGFLAWSTRRPIERFSWTPVSAVAVDASRARIEHLTVNVRTAPAEIVLPRPAGHWGNDFAAGGDLSLLSLALAADSAGPARLHFAPRTHPAQATEPVRLPRFASLAETGSIAISVAPLRQPFDCAGLLQFPRARRVLLTGQLTGLAALAGLTELTDLELRYCPDLSELPPLATWPSLNRVIGWNIEETAGKRLRTEIRNLTRTAGRSWAYASVTKLRRPEWFATERDF